MMQIATVVQSFEQVRLFAGQAVPRARPAIPTKHMEY